jgi:hypothetical protein
MSQLQFTRGGPLYRFPCRPVVEDNISDTNFDTTIPKHLTPQLLSGVDSRS